MKSSIFTRLITVVLVMSLFLIIAIPCGALMVEYDLERLVKESDAVVIGKVAEKTSYWNDDKTSIYTVVKIEVAEKVIGEARNVISVRFSGGEISNEDGTGIGFGLSDTPRFEVDENVLLFLQKPKDVDMHKVTARFQGKFSVVKDKGTEESLVKSASKVIADSETLKTKEAKEFTVPLKDFTARIKQIDEKLREE